jgi:hypothetical protein
LDEADAGAAVSAIGTAIAVTAAAAATRPYSFMEVWRSLGIKGMELRLGVEVAAAMRARPVWFVGNSLRPSDG